jgi:glycosyltransferase involved in cell wall biosynthesis
MQWLENRANRHASAVTVNSEAVRADVLRREKIDPAKIRLIYNGVEVGSPPEPRRIAAELIAAFDAVPAPPPRLKLIVCVANLIHYKGHPTLIEAMERVAAAEPSARLLLVGRDGGMEGAIREAIARRGLTERIAILGATNRPEIVYRAADVVVLPSHEEGFSNVILEAMAAGRAIVATAVGGTPEAARDGREAWLVPPRDAGALATALTAALGDSAERERLAAAARRRVEDLFSLARMHGDYEMLYRELVQ